MPVNSLVISPKLLLRSVRKVSLGHNKINQTRKGRCEIEASSQQGRTYIRKSVLMFILLVHTEYTKHAYIVRLGRLLCIRKTCTEMDQIRLFFWDKKHERRPSYAYGFGLLFFRQTRTGLPMRVRYSNEIAEWKWPPIFQNKRVRYARKSRRAGPLQ